MTSKQTIDTKNDKNTKFIELAQKRVQGALDKLRLIGNLSDKKYYSYTEQDVKAIFDALNSELRNARLRFEKAQNKKKFRLPGAD